MTQIGLKAFREAKVFILDPEREYKKLVEYYQGNWIDVGKGSQGRINPLQVFNSLDTDVAPLAGHIEFLEQFFSFVCPDISDKELVTLKTMLEQFYLTFSKANQSLTLTEFTNYLRNNLEAQPKNKELEALSIYFTRFSKGSLDGRLWNGATTIKSTQQVTVFDLFTLSNAVVTDLLVLKCF